MKKLTILFPILLTLLLIFNGIPVSAAANENRVNVIIGFDFTPGPSEQALVKSFGGNIKFTYHIVPAIAASIPETAI